MKFISKQRDRLFKNILKLKHVIQECDDIFACNFKTNLPLNAIRLRNSSIESESIE